MLLYYCKHQIYNMMDHTDVWDRKNSTLNMLVQGSLKVCHSLLSQPATS